MLCLSLGLLASLAAPSQASAQTTSPTTPPPVTTRLQVPPSAAMTNLNTWQWGTSRFFPTGTANAYVVLLYSRECPEQFNAYGYDLSLGRMTFFASGPATLRLRFLDTIQRETTGIPDNQKAVTTLTLNPHLPTTTTPPTTGGTTRSTTTGKSKTTTTSAALTAATNRIVCASPPEQDPPQDEHPIFPPDLAVIHTFALALTEFEADQKGQQHILNATHETGP
jgi:hypothetical protein